MKLYKTKGLHTEDGVWVKKWDGTQADASKRRKEFKQERRFTNVETEEVDVPTDKTGLMRWLNVYCSGE